MNIRERIAALQARQSQLVQQGLDLSNAAETSGRSMSEVELATLTGWREQAESIGREIDQLLPLAQAERAHADGIASLGPARTDGAPAQRDERPAGIRVNEQIPWRTAGEFIRDLVGSTPNGLNGGQVDQAMAGRIATHMETRVTQVSGDTPGLLPEPIVGQVMNDVDDARPFITSLGAKPLGNVSGKTFSRPVVTQHTNAGAQPTELGPLPGQKLIVSPVDFIKSAAGSSVQVSRQEIDWTDPQAWQLILDDMAAMYAEYTDDVAATALGTAVTQTVAVAADDLDSYIAALYQGAYQVLTKNGTTKARTRRIPNVVWTSADMWASIGAAIDKTRAQANPEVTGLGSGGVGKVNGSILDLPRILVPGLNAGTAIIGRTEWTEFYEQRIGLLQAVQPSVLGVEIAVPGYIAYGTLDATAFCEITAPPVVP